LQDEQARDERAVMMPDKKEELMPSILILYAEST
jgi:hypothetical protein